MGIINVNIDKIYGRASQAEVDALKGEIEAANRMLYDGSGKGGDFLGWVSLPGRIGSEELEAVEACARSLASLADVIVVIGIGGSYLGTKAVYEAMNDSFQLLRKKQDRPLLLFAGQNLSEDYLSELLAAVKPYRIAAIVISKSGTTTEPAVAFRLIKEEIESRYGKAEASKRIVAVTDAKRGALRTLATQEGYATFVIPDNVGGRYSVLTPVGLLPLAAAGVRIGELVRGAQDMEKATGTDVPFERNPSALYAAARTALYRKGCKIEILGSYDPKLLYVAEWWKQLYGESEGKEGKGIFPASVTLTADLHSMGQYIQDGRRMLFETVVRQTECGCELKIPFDESNVDKLNYIAGESLFDVNEKAFLGTLYAHRDGGVPSLVVEYGRRDEESFGALVYFFCLACAASAYILGVNPFNQPGVEAYKKNMFALLDKPGYEEASKAIKARL